MLLLCKFKLGKLSFSEIKALEQRQVNSPSGHQNDSVRFISSNIHANLASKRQLIMLGLVKLDIKRDKLHCGLDTNDWAVYPYVSIESLVIDVFDDEAYLLLNDAVTACVQIYLLELAKSLR